MLLGSVKKDRLYKFLFFSAVFTATLFFTLIVGASPCWKETSDSLGFPFSGQVPARPTTARSPGLSRAEESL